MASLRRIRYSFILALFLLFAFPTIAYPAVPGNFLLSIMLLNPDRNPFHMLLMLVANWKMLSQEDRQDYLANPNFEFSVCVVIIDVVISKF